MPRASSVCYYCKVQFRGKDTKLQSMELLSNGHGPPTTEVAYGSDPTPDGKVAHGALSLESPKAHRACASWVHAINVHVASVRRSRSAGIDERTPAVQRSRQTPSAAVKAEKLAIEAATFEAGYSRAEPFGPSSLHAAKSVLLALLVRRLQRMKLLRTVLRDRRFPGKFLTFSRARIFPSEFPKYMPGPTHVHCCRQVKSRDQLLT